MSLRFYILQFQSCNINFHNYSTNKTVKTNSNITYKNLNNTEFLHVSNSCAAIQIQRNNVMAIKCKHPENAQSAFYYSPNKQQD